MTENVEVKPVEAVKTPPAEEVISVKAQKRYEDDISKWKQEYRTTKDELESVKTKTESEKNELAGKVDTLAKERKAFESKYINAEVKAQAIAAGIRDVEFVKLIESAEIKIDADGNVTGIDKAIKDLKERKPDWFGAEKKSSTSTNASFPNKEKTTVKTARDMTAEEWAKAKPKAMRGNFK